MRTYIGPIFFNDFARDRARKAAIGKVVNEYGLGIDELDLKRVFVQRFDALERRIVI